MLNQPTSSPMITTIFGLRCCCCAAAGKIVTTTAINSDRRPSQILLPAAMSECLRFLRKWRDYRFTDDFESIEILIGRHRKEYWTLGKCRRSPNCCGPMTAKGQKRSHSAQQN